MNQNVTLEPYIQEYRIWMEVIMYALIYERLRY